MGAVGGLLGTAGGMGGTGFTANSGTTGTQINTSYNQGQEAMQKQQDLLGALQNQNGLGNQSQVYNQLQGTINGTGPNPAQAQLAQATGANVANQAALMAGQRGASGNPALMARQAAQAGAGIQQNAAGQAATMQANQSLNAMGAAGNMANTMAGQQIGQVNQNVASRQNAQNILQGANSSNNNIQGQLANTTLGGQQKMIGGAMNAAGAGAGAPSGGGAGMAEGGQVNMGIIPTTPPQGPQSAFGQSLGNYEMPTFSAAPAGGEWGQGAKKSSDPMKGAKNIAPSGAADLGSPMAPGMAVAAKGGKVPAMVSPGERFLKPGEAQAVAKGNANPLAVGEKIPGQPKYKGNDYRNDVVRKDLDAGGVVLPLSVMNSKNPEKSAAAFVRDVLAKKGRRS